MLHTTLRENIERLLIGFLLAGTLISCGTSASPKPKEIHTPTYCRNLSANLPAGIDTEYILGYFDKENEDCVIYSDKVTPQEVENYFSLINLPAKQATYIKVKLGTPPTVKKYAYSGRSRKLVSSTDLDCVDFTTKEAAQTASANGDPHNLDGDNDGEACEWGVGLQAMKHYTKPIPKPTPPKSNPPYSGGSSRCGSGKTYVSPYTRRDGTRVKGHCRSKPR